MFLGTAGLLAGQPQDGRGNQPDKEWRDRLVRFWMSLPHPDVMPPGAWHLLKVRPNNSPVFRLVAMSYLLHRYREKGFLEGLVGLVREAHLSRNVYRSLEAGLVVNADGQTLLGRGGWVISSLMFCCHLFLPGAGLRLSRVWATRRSNFTVFIQD